MADKNTVTNPGGPRATARGHAVVLGASIAGTLAARVLADSYQRVTIVERDVLPEVEQRRGAPQGRHLHGLMECGRQIMEELFPGLTAELGERGAPMTEVLVKSRWYLSGLQVHPTPTGLTSLLASRPLLESVMRARATALPGVCVRQRLTAVGLITAPGEANRVAGVRVVPTGDGSRNDAFDGGAPTDGTNPADARPDRTEVISADLVVDATGRGSRAPQWLTEIGQHQPSQERIDIDLGYSSCTFRRRPEHLGGDIGVVVSTMPGQRGGGAIALEGDRWHITLGGMLGDHPPTDHEGFRAFAATLPVPDIHELVTQAEPLGDPVPHRFRGSLRRHYEDLRMPPEGFLAIGDAVCSFNPLYAQGMTVAAQQVQALRDCLCSDEPALPRRFYRQAARLIDTAWQMSSNADLNHPGVQGRRTLRIRLVNAYLHRVRIAAHADPTVARTFMRLANLMEPPEALLRPSMIARVLRHS
ncbi:NAD(P)/FAD-dependent oxidoreductase [Candidatus Protofrankia californiensis]|uniref:NAD(P)/FAD-dependent oxidoreductase n=1 Tax=Candidatus Protofrankia californiensis TaxID=1839754 RepID=UPI001041168F|nr:FAD-dependent oxidoreductase [Candidatus Protofrankia californiensis]